MGIEISTYFDLLGSILSRVSSNHDDYFHCESIVRKWADYSNTNEIKENDLNLKDLLLFLHVPRTGGRTYFHWWVPFFFFCLDSNCMLVWNEVFLLICMHSLTASWESFMLVLWNVHAPTTNYILIQGISPYFRLFYFAKIIHWVV